ncbi:MAG: alginate lyase family protein [Sphingobium sp.]|uniref:alginate lyase family protein n=1 Tax=Sphingobium sp. TaxID=1912891 RepID=UPI0029AF8C88|nr:alginate lyase family protein [Sphingobium sp.]MDX3909070.1 alginate lyase family protein [Sphingobium sp.]
MHRLVIKTASYLLLSSTFTACAAQEWQPAALYPALARLAPGKDTEVFSCEAPPPAVVDIQTVSKYGETAGKLNNSSVVDAEAESEYLADIAPIKAFSKFIVKRADNYVEGSSSADAEADCALTWLDGWAKGGAFLGNINRQGQSVRKWELGTFATTYLKVESASADTAQKARIKKWISDVAYKAKEDFSTRTELKSRRNNHLYWAAWGVLSAGLATGDRKLFDWGVDCYRFALAQIRDDGSLELEMERRKRAASYHMFALAPLIMIAEAGEVNGLGLYAEKGHRLQKLIDLNIAALDNLNVIGDKAGYKQEDLYNESNLAWMEPYYARFHDERVLKWMTKYRPMASTRLGGDLTQLYSPAVASEGSVVKQRD